MKKVKIIHTRYEKKSFIEEIRILHVFNKKGRVYEPFPTCKWKQKADIIAIHIMHWSGLDFTLFILIYVGTSGETGIQIKIWFQDFFFWDVRHSCLKYGSNLLFRCPIEDLF